MSDRSIAQIPGPSSSLQAFGCCALSDAAFYAAGYQLLVILPHRICFIFAISLAIHRFDLTHGERCPQAGSLSFLAQQGFDFNKCIREGVSSMPAVVRDEAIARLAAHNGEAQHTPLPFTKPEDLGYMQHISSQVVAWLQVCCLHACGGSTPPPCVPALHRRSPLLGLEILQGSPCCTACCLVAQHPPYCITQPRSQNFVNCWDYIAGSCSPPGPG